MYVDLIFQENPFDFIMTAIHSNKLTCYNVLPVPVTLKVHLNHFIFRIVKRPKLISRLLMNEVSGANALNGRRR